MGMKFEAAVVDCRVVWVTLISFIAGEVEFQETINIHLYNLILHFFEILFT
jgi:hypothetical protein